MRLLPFSLIFSVLAVLLVLASGCARSPEAKRKLAEETANRMQADLLNALTKAIADKGPAGAIEVCRTLSPETEKKLSQSGLMVRRVSDRTRNPLHRPDELEAKVLSEWKAQMSEKKEIRPYAENTAEGFRFMKPIQIGNEACLQCHGDPAKMKSDVKAALSKLYPEDQATGYSMGELRGAISITVK